MRRAILLVTVIIAAILLGSSAVAFAAPPDKAASKKSGSEKAVTETTAPEKAVTETTAPEPTDQSGPITIENHTWNGYHWARKSNPFTVKLLKDRLRETIWDKYLATTSFNWSQDYYGSTDSSTDSNTLGTQDMLNTTVPDASSRTTSRKCPYVQGQVQVCDYTYGSNGWLGIASIYISGSHITQGVVKMNDTYFNTSKYNTSAWRNLVMCQEVGHTLGLDHQDENFSNTNLNTCMDYTNDPASNQHPNQHDYDQLTTIYQHPDSSTTLAQTAGTSTDPGNTPRQWGKEIWREENGRASVFEKKFDKEGKKKQLTHVLWTPEQAEKLKKGTKPQDQQQEGQQEQTQQEQQKQQDK